MEDIKHMIKEHLQVKEEFLEESENIKKVVEAVITAFQNKKKLLICGNGGSAADAQHWAAEFMGRYKKERPGLPAIALTTDSSMLTAWSNDYDYESVFKRQVQALGEKGDILIGLSTSGNSKNVMQAFAEAKSKGLLTVSLTGNKGGTLKDVSDLNINVPSNNTPRIQEGHLLAYHIICELVENELSP